MRSLIQQSREPRTAWRDAIVAESPAMRLLLDHVERLAPSSVPVLVIGETGVGKELIARAMHAANPHARPLVILNCATLPTTLAESELFGHIRGAFTGADRATDGLIAQADGGTLILDEVAELAPDTQAKLLRVLEDGISRPVGGVSARRVEVRLVCVTNRDLAAAVAAGHFRADLYHRIAGVTVVVPSLRDHREDIPSLVRRFLDQELGGRPAPPVPDETLAFLRASPWPGNVRELRQAVRRALALGVGGPLRPHDFATADAIPRAAESFGTPSFEGKRWSEIERDVLVWAIDRYRSLRAAARALGVPRSTLADRLRRHGISVVPCANSSAPSLRLTDAAE